VRRDLSRSTVDDPRIAELEDIVRINFLGMVYSVEAALPAMLERGSGHTSVFRAWQACADPVRTWLLGQQGGGCGLSESLRSELRQRGVTVTTVFPAMLNPVAR
jgi:short-subunit dehydrogenase